ncbi:MAG: VWA domain-containing protein [Myxococcales bacterium]|nr:VWA domain-containing protein [Myxococcales bacterium]
MFLDFFYNLRDRGLPVGTHGWMSLMEALARGLHGDSLDGFYGVARSLLVTSESQLDTFDRVFAETFRGVVADAQALLTQLDEWLKDPKRLLQLDPALKAMIEALDLEELRRQLMERLAQQRERHEGGNRWVGTGGTSPFGQGGYNPAGIRMGGVGGGRSALAVADSRRFAEFRRDLVLDTRQIAAALRRLRKLAREEGEPELDLDETVDATARNCGDIEVVLRPPRTNNVRLLLLLDVGGSMDPHAHLVSRLFSAAHQGGNFRELRFYYFHNCVYDRLFHDAAFTDAVPTRDVLRELDAKWYVIVVGDAYMHPGELLMTTSDFWSPTRGPSGLTWLARVSDHFPRSAWLNPEPPRLWDSGTIAEIRQVFPMFALTLAGLDEMIVHLRRPRDPKRRMLVSRLARVD